jgi:superoxide dismutase, Fe-Mn family
MERRKFIGDVSKATLGTIIGGSMLNNLTACSPSNKIKATKTNSFLLNLEQQRLAYGYADLSTYIDEQTMTIHHTKHATAYLKNAKDEWDLITNKKEWDKKTTLLNVLENINSYTPKMRNNLGGHFNHEMFWKCLTPKSTAPSATLTKAINANFGSLEAFKTKFGDAAKNRFGSGWAWLSVDANKNLFISSTPNQDNPIMNAVELRGTPILALDVWEHAYYLKYQNKRADYITAFWNIVNWNYVDSLYDALI